MRLDPEALRDEGDAQDHRQRRAAAHAEGHELGDRPQAVQADRPRLDRRRQQGAHRGARALRRPATTTASSRSTCPEATTSSDGSYRGDGEAGALERGLHPVVRGGIVDPHADLAHEVGVSGLQALDSGQRGGDLLDAARAVHALDLEYLGDHAVSVPGACGTPGTLEAGAASTADQRQQPVASGCRWAGIEPTVSVTVRLLPSPPVTASRSLSPAA